MLMLQKEFKLCYNSFNRSSLATYLKARRLNGVWIKQIIANFLRKLIKLDDYIDDRVLSEIERLEREIEEIRDLANSNEYELNDRPNFYDMESQVEELVNDSMADVYERIEALEE